MKGGLLMGRLVRCMFVLALIVAPLAGAVRGADSSLAKAARAGADPRAAATEQTETARSWAAGEGHLEVINALLAAGADPNVKAHVSTLTERKHADHATGGFTALMFAVRNGHENVGRALVKAG